jgi:hypothetical protein
VGTAGQRVSLGIIDFAGDVSILLPDGTKLASNRIFTSVGDIDIAPLSDTGTYTVVVDPGVLTGSLTLTLSEPVTGVITINGQSVPVILNRPGQDARLTFEGMAGQQLRLGLREVTFDTIFASVIVSLFSPGEATLVSRTMNASGGNIDTDPLPATGIYTVVVNPQQTKTASLTLTLAQVVP